MDERDGAEWRRLDRAMQTGPGRRMIADTLAGRALSRADIWQMESINRQMAALVEGRK